MIFRTRHLAEDCLFDCYLAEQGGESIEPPTAEHLADCAVCRARYADLRRFMDGLRTEADAELNEIFPLDRLRAQQRQIARRIENLGHHARVISFPGHGPDHGAAAASWRAPWWAATAAAAGLAVGVAIGSLYYSSATPVTTQTIQIAEAPGPVHPATPPAEPSRVGDVVIDNEAFLSELELALERPRTRELVALDELTPHVREVRVQLR
jgi:hypothetical protein